MNSHNRTPRMHAFLSIGALAVSAFYLPGCQLAGVLAKTWEDTGSKDVAPEYAGLHGKTFAVLVAVDPALTPTNPGVGDYILNRITERLADPTHDTGATGYVSAAEVGRYAIQNPGWTARSVKDIGKDLGVDVLIWVELTEYRFHEAGNPYVYDAIAGGSVGVFDLTSTTPSEYAYRKSISVTAPDKKRVPTTDIPFEAVNTLLARRFVDRVSWAFYTHEEANRIQY